MQKIEVYLQNSIYFQNWYFSLRISPLFRPLNIKTSKFPIFEIALALWWAKNGFDPIRNTNKAGTCILHPYVWDSSFFCFFPSPVCVLLVPRLWPAAILQVPHPTHIHTHIGSNLLAFSYVSKKNIFPTAAIKNQMMEIKNSEHFIRSSVRCLQITVPQISQGRFGTCKGR